jgi:beta-phosphoglucomutase-like phosphatase (HAD superfamily)
LDLFDTVRTGDDVAKVKPAPDLYWAAAEALGVEPRRCLAFEDSANGVRAAKAAGMTCIAVPGPVTRGLNFDLADAVLNSLDEVSLAEIAGGIPDGWRRP